MKVRWDHQKDELRRQSDDLELLHPSTITIGENDMKRWPTIISYDILSAGVDRGQMRN